MNVDLRSSKTENFMDTVHKNQWFSPQIKAILTPKSQTNSANSPQKNIINDSNPIQQQEQKKPFEIHFLQNFQRLSAQTQVIKTIFAKLLTTGILKDSFGNIKDNSFNEKNNNNPEHNGNKISSIFW